MSEPAPSPQGRNWLLGAAAAVLVAVVVLAAQGQPWWCACGSWAPWVGESNGRHTSQHLLDPYSFTHFLHGLLFFALLSRVARGRAQLALAVTAEACWELIENSHWVVERYRAATIALDYHGDSVANSLGDIACCVAGFLVARRVPVKVSILLFVAIELALLATVRDNLTLNIIMLVAPSEAVKHWQSGG
jgi:hypothetical protein